MVALTEKFGFLSILPIVHFVIFICVLDSNNLVNANSYLNDGKNVLIPKSSQFCEGCYATIDILLKEFTNTDLDIKGPYRMDEKWKELEENLCDTSKLTKYVYSPPKVVKVCQQMFRKLQDELIDVVRNLDKMSFEEHVKYTCIEKLDACTNYISIPSVERKIERELEKEKREKLDNKNRVIDSNDDTEDRDSSVTPTKQTQTIRVVNDEL